MAARLKRKSENWKQKNEAKKSSIASRHQRKDQSREEAVANHGRLSSTVDASRLPPNVWLHVLKQLDLPDRCRLAQTCRLFHQLFLDPSLWRKALLRVDTVKPEGGLRMREVDKEKAGRFGRHFQHVDLHLQCTHMPLEINTLLLLPRLAVTWTLKSLRLSAPAFGMGFSKELRASTNNGLQAAVQVIESATQLQKLDLRQWPLTSDVLALEDRHLGIDSVLTSPGTCPSLRSLDIRWKYTIRPPLPFGDDTGKRSPQTALGFVTKFKQLQELNLHDYMLSDGLLDLLASHGTLQSMCVCVPFKLGTQGPPPPALTAAAWRRLKAACFRLEIKVEVACPFAPLAPWVLQTHIPLTAFRVRFLPRHARTLATEMLVNAALWKDTLQRVEVDVLSRKTDTAGDLNDHAAFALDHSLDELLLSLAVACPNLVQLVFFGEIRADTVIKLAAQDRRWTTFAFSREGLKPGLDDEECSLLDDVMIDRLSATVSRSLGFKWRPTPDAILAKLLSA